MKWVKMLGPGLLYAGAAIGVSHIVQSTKAGANYGYILIIGIVLAHILKYPFFEMGPRFAAATGKNLIQGFDKLGKWALYLTLFLTVSTMFAIQGAVTMVTAGIANKLFGLDFPDWGTSFILLIICAGILIIGKFNVLDRFMKVIMVTLAITTILAVAASFFADIPKSADLMHGINLRNNPTDIAFLIAFIGWMPAPLDISIWHSLWSVESAKIKKSNLGAALFDFKIGYWGTAFLALCFLILGANVIYGTDIQLAAGGKQYAGQLIDLYTTSLGSWSYYLIAIAAFTTMFSTTLTCLDAQPRVVAAILPLLGSKKESDYSSDNLYKIGLTVLIVGTVVMLNLFVSNMGQIVTFATTISFLTAPVIAFLCLKVVNQLPKDQRISRGRTYLGWLGILFLAGFSIYYLISL